MATFPHIRAPLRATEVGSKSNNCAPYRDAGLGESCLEAGIGGSNLRKLEGAG